MITRRSLLGGLAAAPVLLHTGTAGAAGLAAGTEFAALRAKAFGLLTGVPFDPADPAFAAPLARLDASASALHAALDRTAGRTVLWADQPLTGIAGTAGSYQRLRTLALARATPGTSWYGRPDLATDVLAGLDLLYDRAYNETKRETGNWWFWEIGAPRALLDTCVLLHDLLSPEQRAAWLRAVDRFCPNPDRRTNLPTLAETGANRADKALIVALRGVVGESAEKLALARDGLSDVRDAGRNSLFRLVGSGDGFYADGSFVQHGVVAYTGSYGVVLLQSLSSTLGLLGGSSWEVRDPAVAVVLDAVERTYAPWLHDGLMMDAVRGRAVSRQAGRDHHAGRDAVDAILQLAAGAPAAYAGRFRELAKGWVSRGRFVELAGIPAIARARAVLADPTVATAPRPSGHHVFAAMDRVVHRRPEWSFALSLSSTRIAMYECGNGENYRAWYQGDGATYLYTDLDHYSADYWPTVDSYRLAGTTVDTRRRDPAVSVSGTGAFRARNAWAGGTTVDGYGVASLDLMAAGSTLVARKSWVCLDDAVVCLGAGISSTDGRPVETVVDNRGGAGALTRGTGWAHLAGVGGYAFPAGEGGGLRTLREVRTDSWRAINDGADTGGSADPVSREYVTLWFDHGPDPADASYAYILLPGATPEQTAAYDRAEILANTASVQAVTAHGRSVGGGKLFAAVFWAAGEAGGVTADAPCTVLVRQAAGRIRVAVADPGRSTATVTVRLGRPAHRVVTADPAVSVDLGENAAITVTLSGSRGRTHTADLAIGGKGQA
ncbi:polysaccharide lyase 8 family protein [Nonomuraea sp. NPDC050310]|uniref:polysaccharide lyase 8 family protein n=1 Tax=Nonomuraea sp. NPDC050310 TaxID=3154935 RepID=UPI0033F79D58